MRNIRITIMEDMKYEDVVVREMNDLEFMGAHAYISQLLNDWSEEIDGTRPYSIETVDNDTVVCNKKLHVVNEGYRLFDDNGNDILLDCVFMIENNKNDLWGLAREYDKETETYLDEFVLVRI